jgi:cytochrome c oxidase cbb3-type subunit 1
MTGNAAPTETNALHTAARHSLGWLVFGNCAGLYLSLLLLAPSLQVQPWTYGRWVPVHLNIQLYGWSALPLIAWLFSMFEVDRCKLSMWGSAAVWAWTSALVVGAANWLGGSSSGKIFLDWTGPSLWAFTAAQMILWLVLAAAWKRNATSWSKARRLGTTIGLLGLALVPLSLIFASSPSVYPPVDRSTGGPTGSSLQGSALFVIGLMLLIPRVAAQRNTEGESRGIWIFFIVSWIVFGVAEWMGGTHFDLHQIGSMLFLLPWVWWLPRDWKNFHWPDGSKVWRVTMFFWWGILVVTSLAMYQPGALDHIKFTQALVAHSHLAMAGFTSSFCALLLVLLTNHRLGPPLSVISWHAAVLVMIAVLALMGWMEGFGPSWMLHQPAWRTVGLVIRALCGVIMLGASVSWLRESRKLTHGQAD